MKSKPPNKGSSQWSLLKDIHSLIVFLCTFFMGMGVHVVAPGIPEIMSSFKVNEVRVGLVMSLFTFPTIILSPIIGSLTGRYGRKIFLAGGMLLFGISGALPVFLKFSFNLLLVTRVIQGVGFAASMPLTIAILGDLYDGNKEVAAQGIRTFFWLQVAFYFRCWEGLWLAWVGIIPFFLFRWQYRLLFLYGDTCLKQLSQPLKNQ